MMMKMKNNKKVIINDEKEEEEEKDDDAPLPGFRFHPTDQELLGFYLRRKVENRGGMSYMELIKHVDIYKFDPWDLIPCCSGGSSTGNVGVDKEWYFFCKRGRKYKNSTRPNRVTPSGFWKATGIDRPIYSASHAIVIGLKKSLVFYRGAAGKGTKTDWMMHEFRLPHRQYHQQQQQAAAAAAEVWTLCRIIKRNNDHNIAKPYKPPCSSNMESADNQLQLLADTESPLISFIRDQKKNQDLVVSNWNQLTVFDMESSTVTTTCTSSNLNLNDYSYNNTIMYGNWDNGLSSHVYFQSCFASAAPTPAPAPPAHVHDHLHPNFLS